MKIMGIDYGDARTGVAVSDLLCTIVGSTTVVPSRNTEKAIADIVRIAKEQQVGLIVVGLPRNMDGTEGPRAELCRGFAEYRQRRRLRRDYKFFRCPSCRNRLRLPRGKGRIQITCPRCGHRFGGKT